MHTEKTYFDLLASLDETSLRRAVELHLAANECGDESLKDEAFAASAALGLNESQAHVFYDYMQIDWQSADFYFDAMRRMPIDFDIGYDSALPGFYYDSENNVVLACGQWIAEDGEIVSEATV